MKRQIFMLIMAVLLVSFTGCRKDEEILYDHISYEEAKMKMPEYDYLLCYLIRAGYEFWDFDTYIHASPSDIPEKLIVMRHDIHLADVIPSYYMYKIESELLDPGCATYFVMLNDPTEIDDQDRQLEYLELIRYLKKNNVDIQPHISPNDMISYHFKGDNYWRYGADIETIRKILDENYSISCDENGHSIDVINDDVFDIQQKLDALRDMLVEYNQLWLQQTGIPVRGYAAHGSSIPVNKVLNNAIILDLKELLNDGIYLYDSYNTKRFRNLSYYGDSYRPEWMNNPGLIKKEHLQMLAHPNQWYRP